MTDIDSGRETNTRTDAPVTDELIERRERPAATGAPEDRHARIQARLLLIQLAIAADAIEAARAAIQQAIEEAAQHHATS